MTRGTYIYYNQGLCPIIFPVIREVILEEMRFLIFRNCTQTSVKLLVSWNTFFPECFDSVPAKFSVIYPDTCIFLPSITCHIYIIFSSFFNIPVPKPIICEVISLRIGSRSNNDLSKVYAEGMFNLNNRFFFKLFNKSNLFFES